jgi:primosomal protein N' (replication factor Y)
MKDPDMEAVQESQGRLFEIPEPPEESPTQEEEKGTKVFAEIVFDRPLDHSYSYGVPSRFQGALEIGKRVMAPFGRGDRPTIGYCVGLTETPPERAVKRITSILDDRALVTPTLMKLTRWMADYYLCAWGQVLNAVVPSGVKQRAGTKNVYLIELVPETLWPNPLPALSIKQKSILDLIKNLGKPVEAKQLGRLAQCGPGPIRALVDKNLLIRKVQRVENLREQQEEENEEKPMEEGPTDPERLTLTEDQAKVWTELEKAVQEGGFQPFLIHGVTGSGKTELYLRAIEEVVKQGKEALVLVPEISLTPQTIQAFRGRCGEVAVLHSNLQAAERGSHWRRIAAGHVHVVVGARSAIFAPTKKLGLIVIDEEHESTFKQESTPRYHARDVAIMRARLEECPVILGSATPSLESWYNAQRGQYKLLSLPRRVLDRPMPQVALVDLRHDRHADRRYHGLSPSLERSMQQALQSGGQVMLLLNRRGFSTYVHCPSCGYVEQCRFCDLALTYHKDRDINLCHYCGYEDLPKEKCPQCGLGQIRYHGLGTEKLQGEIEAKFPEYVVRRMDSDTMRRPGSHKRLLDSFRKGEIQILLGTQMIAKGLDFPNVTLVGVVNADVALHRADFRAGERTFQLLAQVEGRTGRGPRGGRVMVQTFNPEHPSIGLAATHNFLKFAETEMGHRQKHGYPPYQRMARLIVRSKDAQVASDVAERLAGSFRVIMERPYEGEGPRELRLLGPAEAPVFRLKGYYRFHFQLQSSNSAYLHQVIRHVLPTVKLPSGVELTVDIDPQDMT